MKPRQYKDMKTGIGTHAWNPFNEQANFTMIIQSLNDSKKNNSLILTLLVTNIIIHLTWMVLFYKLLEV